MSALCVIGLGLLGVGVLGAATPARAEGRLLRVETDPVDLHFAGLVPGDRVEFVATVQPLSDEPITLVSHVEAGVGQLLFSAADGRSKLDVSTCSTTWRTSTTQRLRVDCSGQETNVLNPTVLIEDQPLDFDLPEVEPNRPLALRIGLTLTDQTLATTGAETGSASFNLTATQVPRGSGGDGGGTDTGGNPGGGSGDNGPGTGSGRPWLAPTGLMSDPRVALGVAALGFALWAWAARRRKLMEVQSCD